MTGAGRPTRQAGELNAHEADGAHGVRLDPSSVADLAAALAPALRAPSPLLDAEGAAALLGVPASWVLAEARAERIPHVRLGRYVRFDADELRGWAAARARGPRHRTGAHPVPGGRDAA